MWIRMIPYLLCGALVAGVFAVWVDRDKLKLENSRLEREIAAKDRVIETSRLAREVEAARADAAQKRASELDANIQAIVEGGIPDAPLDPRLIDIINSGLRRNDD